MEALLEQLIAYVGDDYVDTMAPLLTNLLNDALEEVCNTLCPYGYSEKEQLSLQTRALKQYPGKIRRIAEYHFDKIGKEGVLGYSENGTSASYENADTPKSLLRGIVPIARIV